MAKGIQCAIELTVDEALRFLEDRYHPKPNPARDETLRRAKALKIKIL